MIALFSGNLSNFTDKMVLEFSKNYGEAITQFDVKQAVNFETSVISAVTESVARTVCESKSATRGLAVRDVLIDKTEPNWSIIRWQEVSVLTYELPESIDTVIEG